MAVNVEPRNPSRRATALVAFGIGVAVGAVTTLAVGVGVTNRHGREVGPAQAGETNVRPRPLYPELEAYRTGWLSVSGGHELYYEESGNPDGQPALFLHGGPGSGTAPVHRRFFDPAAYRIVLLDQRGAGKSRPAGRLGDNTTQDLVADIEALRLHLGVKQWVLYGGSWGSTLALAYAEAHPTRVKALVLRGIFLGGRDEIEWAYKKGGVDRIIPEAYDRFARLIPEAERGDLLRAYHHRITGEDAAERERAVREWDRFEEAADRLVPKLPADDEPVTQAAIDRACITSHYMLNRVFLAENQLLTNIGVIRNIPAVIIQGRYDLTCPFTTAWELKKAWPGADFRVVPDAGHSWREPGITDETIRATDRFR
jgi:proline iminopeptidase